MQLNIKSDRQIKVRALIDLGAQRSYCNRNILDKLGLDKIKFPIFESKVKTFLGEGIRQFREVNLGLNLKGNSFTYIPILMDENLDVSYYVEGLQSVYSNIARKGHKIADAGCNSNHVSIDILLGTDALSIMRPFSFIDCLDGSAISTSFGVISRR